MREQAAATPDAPAEPDMLPEGLWQADGKYMAACRSCERSYEIACEPNEFSEDMSYCGGSQWCTP